MKINEITSDMKLLRELRNARREVNGTPAAQIALTVDCRLGGQTPALVVSAARAVVANAFTPVQLKQAIKQNLAARIAALDAKYAGISVEEG